MSCMLAIRVSKSEWRHFKVPREVYIYTRQLELALKLGGEVEEALKKLYPGRLNPSGIEEKRWMHLQG